jgi:hypothetical protein
VPTPQKFYLEHMGSIFEFGEPARFQESPEGGVFVALSWGQHIQSNGSMGRYSPEKMKQLEEAALRDAPPYDVDDRGNVVQFHDHDNRIVGEIDREAEVGGVPDQSTWWGNDEVTAWAISNGYPEISDMPRADDLQTNPQTTKPTP